MNNETLLDKIPFQETLTSQTSILIIYILVIIILNFILKIWILKFSGKRAYNVQTTWKGAFSQQIWYWIGSIIAWVISIFLASIFVIIIKIIEM